MNLQLKFPHEEHEEIKSKAVVKYSALVPANFNRLECNTNLNLPPSNWLTTSDVTNNGLHQALYQSPAFARWVFVFFLLRIFVIKPNCLQLSHGTHVSRLRGRSRCRLRCRKYKEATKTALHCQGTYQHDSAQGGQYFAAR